MARYGLFIDIGRCTGCYGCVVGCKNWHGIPAGEEGRIKLRDMTTGDFPDIVRWIFPVLCMHCDHPPCVAVCRYEAGYVGEGGIVMIDEKKCVGCELCTFACPYGVRTMRHNGRIADSCDFCLDRITEGEVPFCASSCPTDAMVFGDLDDPESELSRQISAGNAQPLKKKYKTKPKVFYANLKELKPVVC